MAVEQRETARDDHEHALLTFREAMAFLRVSRSTIYRLMWGGRLRGHKIGSVWRFYRRDLLAAVGEPVQSLAPERAQRAQPIFEHLLTGERAPGDAPHLATSAQSAAEPDGAATDAPARSGGRKGRRA